MSATAVARHVQCNLDVALWFASHGVAVFPAKPDKRPYTPNGFKDATTDEAAIRGWWAKWGNALPAIACEAAGLIAIDCDIKPGIDGIAAFKRIAADNGIDLLLSPSAFTPRGGTHCYFTRPFDMEPTNSTGTLPDGIDVRGNGYTIAPGATPPGGKRCYARMPGTPDLAEAYRDGTIPELPPALRAHIEAGKPPKPRLTASGVGVIVAQPSRQIEPRSPPTDREKAYAAEALADEAGNLAHTAKGGRNTALNNAAFAAGTMIGAGWIDRIAVESALRDACQRNGYEAENGTVNLEKTMFSGTEAGMQKPREPLAEGDPPILPGVVDFLGRLRASHEKQAATAAIHGQGAAPSRLWFSDQFDIAKYQGYVIKGLLAPGNVGAIVGQPGAGKSTFTPYLAYAVANGLPFFGLRTRQGLVLYLVAEDEVGIKRRMFALGNKHGHTRACAVMSVGNLTVPAEAKAVTGTVAAFKPSLIILDTMAAAFAGMDENASADMGKVVDFARSLAGTGAAVVLVAHPAKAADGGTATVRGHGSMQGTLDMVLTLTVDDVTNVDATVRGTLSKNKNGPTTRRFNFQKSIVLLGQDDERDNITTTIPVEVVDNVMPAGLDPSTIIDVQDIVDGGMYRRDFQSKEWVGHVVGAVLGFRTPVSNRSDRKELEIILRTLTKDKWLQEFMENDNSRRPRKYVRVGIRAQLLPIPTIEQGSSALSATPAPPLLHP